jgi:hypothetical protein
MIIRKYSIARSWQLAKVSWQLASSLPTSNFDLPSSNKFKTMNILRHILLPVVFLVILASCEEVINVDLNNSDPAFVAEAIIYKDSVCTVRLTRTTSYYSVEKPDYIDDAIIIISDGTSTDDLTYKGLGNYSGKNVIGAEGKTYKIEIIYNGITYEGTSYMPSATNILSLGYAKDNSPSIFNPDGKTVYTIEFSFIDDPDKDNFYMIRYILDGEISKDSYYLITENKATNGAVGILNSNKADYDTITFSEAIFYEGGKAEVQVLSIDESVYDYFIQLNDILYWKRRIYPPAQYNPVSNISNGPLGYFAAWSFDSKRVILE